MCRCNTCGYRLLYQSSKPGIVRSDKGTPGSCVVEYCSSKFLSQFALCRGQICMQMSEANMSKCCITIHATIKFEDKLFESRGKKKRSLRRWALTMHISLFVIWLVPVIVAAVSTSGELQTFGNTNNTRCAVAYTVLAGIQL
jgi:hypothetical protein